jgi:hypothetical protein
MSFSEILPHVSHYNRSYVFYSIEVRIPLWDVNDLVIIAWKFTESVDFFRQKLNHLLVLNWYDICMNFWNKMLFTLFSPLSSQIISDFKFKF